MFRKFLSISVKVLLFLILFLPISVFALVRPTSDFYVNDYANILSEDVEEYIQAKSVKLNNIDGSQIVVVTIPSLEGESIDEYANSLFRDFGIGARDKDNGLLILVSRDDREIRVEVGYGLEGIINDAKAGRFLDRYVIPYLKDNDWDMGIKNGYDAFYKEIVEANNLDLSYSKPLTVEVKHADVSQLLFFAFIGIIFGFFYGETIKRRKSSLKVISIFLMIGIYFISKYLFPFFIFLHVACFIIPFGIMYLINICGIFNLVRSGEYGRYDPYLHRGIRSSGGFRSSGGGFHGGGGSSGGGGASRKF